RRAEWVLFVGPRLPVRAQAIELVEQIAGLRDGVDTAALAVVALVDLNVPGSAEDADLGEKDPPKGDVNRELVGLRDDGAVSAIAATEQRESAEPIPLLVGDQADEEIAAQAVPPSPRQGGSQGGGQPSLHVAGPTPIKAPATNLGTPGVGCPA